MSEVRLQVPIAGELRTRAKVQSLTQGITLAEFVTKALESALAITATKTQKKQ
jgi:hypothetical protein